jgi:DNA-binding transcriptional LysR family regulator
MDILQSMRIFARVVEAGSFTKAARMMDITTANASRGVTDLEAHLKTRLLNRSTRRLALTEAGTRYFHHCLSILEHVELAEAEAADALVHASGRLRIHSMKSFGQNYVVPLMLRYMKKHPSVQMDLTLAQRVPDLLEEGFDVAILLAPELPDSDLVSQRLGTTYNIVCASPEYVALHGMPRVPRDLHKHTCLHLTTPVAPPDRWDLDGPSGTEVVMLPPSVFTVNVAEAMATAIKEGGGIGVLPVSEALGHMRAGTMVRVLPDYRHQENSVFALYASRRWVDAKISTWVSFLRDELPVQLATDESTLGAFVAS